MKSLQNLKRDALTRFDKCLKIILNIYDKGSLHLTGLSCVKIHLVTH